LGKEGVVLCFMGSHFKPKYNDQGFGHYERLFSILEVVTDGCDYIWWAGDFNFRTSPHADGIRNADWTNNLIKEYMALNLPSTWVSGQAGREITKLQDKIALQAEHAGFLIEGSNLFGQEEFTKILPTFQKSKESQCSHATAAKVTKVKLNDGDKTTIDVERGALPAIGSAAANHKQPLCIKTAGEGNCAALPGYLCFAMDRPNSYTDQIFSYGKSLTRTSIQVYYGPSPTDHHPVYAEYTIELGFGLEEQPQHALGKDKSIEDLEDLDFDINSSQL